MLYLLLDNFTNGYKLDWIVIFFIISIILAIATIVTKSPISSVLCLISLFISISLYLIVYNLSFIAISYLLVYVGAVTILFLFTLMLINIRISELQTEGKNSTIMAILVILAFGFIFLDKLPYPSMFDHYYNSNLEDTLNLHTSNTLITNDPIFNYEATVSGKIWDGMLVEMTYITSIGNILYTTLFVHLGLIGIILILALVGTIVITVKLNDSKDILDNNNINILK